MMLIKDNERNCGKWRIAIVDELITGQDGIVGATRMKTGTGLYLERVLQQLYFLELACDCAPQRAQNVPSINAVEFYPRREMSQAPQDAQLLYNYKTFILFQIRDNAILVFIFE